MTTLFPDDRIDGEIRSAVLSPDGKLRYTLTRWWGEGDPDPARLLPWIGLNPSTADATEDDPTIRRIRGFTKSANYKGFVMLNLWAYRATDPKDLHRAIQGRTTWDLMPPELRGAEPVDPVSENDRYILEATRAAGGAVLAWGAWPSSISGPQGQVRRQRVDQVLALLRRLHPGPGPRAGSPIWRLYLQAPGKPRPTSPPHPLYLPASCTLEAW